jgi:rubrerythrin
MAIDVELLKKNIEQKKREISAYQESITTIDNEEVRKLLEEIKENEEENVGKLMKVIEQLSVSKGT